MEYRKVIPTIKTEFKYISGIAIIDSEEIHISGDVFLLDSKPFFKGIWRSCYSDITSILELKLKLNDSEGHEIICNNCAVSYTSTLNDGLKEIKADILELTIKKGNISISKNDEIDIFCTLRMNKFSGEEFDETGNCCVNLLDFVSKNERLYSMPIPEISNCNGYLYFPIRMSKFNNYGKKLIDRLCSLLSFVSANFVDSPYQVLWKNHENYMIQICPGKFSNKGDGIFRIDYPGIVQNYLKSAWTAWENYIGKIDLPALIDYYVLMKNQEFIETKILVGCVWMEAIKYEYASNIAKYKKNEHGYFLKPNNSERFTFKELIQEVYSHFKINNGNLSFIKYRNEIVHQGKISLSFNDKLYHCNLLVGSIEKIMLKILNYKGSVWDCFEHKYVTFK